jgi:hypothetical protein
VATLCGSDPSWGLGAVISNALQCTRIDLATPEELLLGPPPAQQWV